MVSLRSEKLRYQLTDTVQYTVSMWAKPNAYQSSSPQVGRGIHSPPSSPPVVSGDPSEEDIRREGQKGERRIRMDARLLMSGMTGRERCPISNVGHDAFLCHPRRLIAGIHSSKAKIDSR